MQTVTLAFAAYKFWWKPRPGKKESRRGGGEVGVEQAGNFNPSKYAPSYPEPARAPSHASGHAGAISSLHQYEKYLPPQARAAALGARIVKKELGRLRGSQPL